MIKERGNGKAILPIYYMQTVDKVNLFIILVLLFPVFYFIKCEIYKAILKYQIKRKEAELSKAILELEELQKEVKNLKKGDSM